MFFRELAVLQCDNGHDSKGSPVSGAKACEYWEMVLLMPHPSVEGAKRPVFLGARPFVYSEGDKKWHCPRCMDAKTAALKAAEEKANTESKSAATSLQEVQILPVKAAPIVNGEPETQKGK